MREALESPAIFDQHIRVWRSAPITAFRHKRHVGNENLRRIYFLEDGFDDRRLAGDALRVAIHLKIAISFIH